MITRAALETVGLYPEDLRIGVDFLFFYQLSKNFRTNMIGVPCGIKHDAAANHQPLAEGRLASGTKEYRYSCNRLELFEKMFGPAEVMDLETA